MSLFEPNWSQLPGSKISMDWENAPGNGYSTTAILYIRIKGGGVRGYVKSVGDRLGLGGEAKQWKPLGFDKKVKWTDTSFIFVGIG